MPYSTTEETLREVFERAGTVEAVRIFKKPTGESRGMGVITFVDPESVQWAVQNLRDEEVNDRKMWVSTHKGSADPAKGLPPPVQTTSSRVFFSNVPFDVDEDQLRMLFEEVGVVKELSLMKKSEDGSSRGMGHCTFQVPSMAAAAIQALRDRDVGGRAIWIAEDTKGPAVGPSSGSSRVFFSNVPFDVEEAQLSALFEEVGAVKELSIFKNKDGGSRGMGHCTFQEPASAAAAILSLRDRDVGGRPIWVAEDNPKEKMVSNPVATYVPMMPPPQMHSAPAHGRGAGDLVDKANRVFFSNVPYDVSEEQLVSLFENIGSVVELKLFRTEQGRSRGMGHCTFLLHDAAVRAVFELRDVDVGGRPIWVAEDSRGPPRPGAGSSPTPQEALAQLLPAALGVAQMFPPPMLPVVSQRRGPGDTTKDAADPANRVFFSNVPYEISEEQLIELFQQVGTVLELNLFRNEMGRSRGMGHCVFAHPGSAERAIGELRDVNVGGRPIWVAEDSRPARSGNGDRPVFGAVQAPLSQSRFRSEPYGQRFG